MAFSIDLARAETAPFEATPAHELLRFFEGFWRGTTRIWLDPGTPPEETVTELHAELVLGGRWLRIQYRGVAFGKPHAGEMLLGYHKDVSRYELAWIDSSHTGSAILLSTGVASERGVDVLGSYVAGNERWGWRTRLHRSSPTELTMEAFNVTPDGAEYPAIASRLSQVV